MISNCGQKAQESTSQNPGTDGSRTERIQEDSEESISGTENDETEESHNVMIEKGKRGGYRL